MVSRGSGLGRPAGGANPIEVKTSEHQDMVPVPAGGGFASSICRTTPSQIVKEFEPVGRKKRQGAQAAFLQSTMRVNRVNQDALVALQNTGAHALGTARLGLQLGELVEHLSFCQAQRP